MTPTITAFERSPDRGRGLARDMRVRWALEVGQPYDVRLVSFSQMKDPRISGFILSDRYRPMKKAISACSSRGRSSSISRSAMQGCCRTMPMAGRARSHGCLPRSTRWSRRSLISSFATLLERDKTWYEERLPILEDRVRVRLGELSSRLGGMPTGSTMRSAPATC